MVDLLGRYLVTSNRESGFGRYDVVLEPKNPNEDDAIILEFKVRNARREKTLEDTMHSALRQIREKQYEAVLPSGGRYDTVFYKKQNKNRKEQYLDNNTKRNRKRL